jgi:hypothetical protein
LFADKPSAKPFSTEVRKRLAKAMGLNAIEGVTIQYALRRLAEKTLAKFPMQIGDSVDAWKSVRLTA